MTLRTGAGCAHPAEARGEAILNRLEDGYAYCRACKCVLRLDHGTWVAEPTGITKYTETYR